MSFQLDRTKRIYFNEESEALETKEKAKDADDIARGRKKDVKSFFQSKAKLKKAAGNLSVKQEEVDKKSKTLGYFEDKDEIDAEMKVALEAYTLPTSEERKIVTAQKGA